MKTRRDGMVRVIRPLVLLGGVSMIGLSIATRVWPGDLADTPDDFSTLWHFGGFTFRTLEPLAAIGALVLLLVALVIRARFAGLLLAAYSAVVFIPTVGALLPRTPPEIRGEGLTLFSANLELRETDTSRLLAEIRAASPDIIALQECTPARLPELVEALSSDYPHHIAAFRDEMFGQVVFSRRAFLGEPEIYPHDHLRQGARTTGLVGLIDPQIRVVVLVDEAEVVVQCVHFAARATPAMLIENRRQAAWLAEWVQSERRGVVIVGDHNFTSRSPQADVFHAAGLREAHSLAGSGWGGTWRDKGVLRHLPGFRIDRVEVANGITAAESRLCGSIGSDHRAIVVRVGWTEEGRAITR